jgi:hypothetical protein
MALIYIAKIKKKMKGKIFNKKKKMKGKIFNKKKK